MFWGKLCTGHYRDKTTIKLRHTPDGQNLKNSKLCQLGQDGQAKIKLKEEKQFGCENYKNAEATFEMM